MTNPAEPVPGVIFYSYLSTLRKARVGFLSHNTLVLVVSGHFTLETSVQKVTLTKGEMLLIGKNQLGQITKTPLPGEDYETIVISLQEDLLRKIALEEHMETPPKYVGPPNVLIPANDFLRGYFQSVMPYVRNPTETITNEVALLKVKEAVKLLLHAMPRLGGLLFDFSAPYKIDLEKFMINHFQYNIPITEFAELTGRSLAGFKRDFQKVFGMAPRHWLQEKRLTEARALIEKQKKPSEIYLDLGFESLSHFSNSFKNKFGKAPSEWSLRRV
ncbi:helix-turn-helix domain-containing protein [Parachryseolinea silvisoli]|uniref:helix-turn-helix domain-containing protein n=1 Tax=Parachryseolinea silvisoli TaxID=2873601 RepID=UPI002265F50C|nr:AraC family transcriptional regulator [Parachryseolinea silvisoli]MCD9018039.1 AraC family transcriptional regulator [Parachryseolinea silvisoli]